MKTKQQALANPEPGDRWRKGQGTLKLTNLSADRIVYEANRLGIRIKHGRPMDESFRLWASNATYLGNETEAASEYVR